LIVKHLNIPARAAETPEVLFGNLQAAITGRFAEHGEQIANPSTALQAMSDRAGVGGVGISGSFGP
jgi:hypothetical protein